MPQYLNDPACPVRVPLPQGKPEQNSTKPDEEASAKSEEISAEPTLTDAAAAAATGNEERVMVALAVGVLGSKPVGRLRPRECRRLAELAVEAFLGSRGLGDDGRVRAFVTVLPWKACKGQSASFRAGTWENDDVLVGRPVLTYVLVEN